MSGHRLQGHLSVDASARRVRQYRYAEERMMRTLGGWIALTPELTAKLLFGRHVWDCAQHADAWGRRLPELRAPAQQSEAANEAVVRFFDLVESAEGPRQTLERVVAIYGVLKPHLATLYERHLAASNPVYEPPTRRILERCLAEELRHVTAGAAVLARLVADEAAQRRRADWEQRLVTALEAAGGVCGDARGALIAPGRRSAPPGDDIGDLAAAPPDFDPAVLPADLRGAVDEFREALQAGHRATLAAWIDGGVRDAVMAAAAALGERPGESCVVGTAALGAYRVVKLRLAAPGHSAYIQLRWVPTDAGWRIRALDVVAS